MESDHFLEKVLDFVRGVERYQQNAVGLTSSTALALEPNSLIDGGLSPTQVLSMARRARRLWNY